MSDGVSIGNLTGSNINVGGSGSTNQIIGSPSAAEEAPRRAGSGPEHALYAFADIVGYSQLTARLQQASQDYLAGLLDEGITEADVSPGRVTCQDQGDARMMKFPSDADAGKVLAVMPRFLNEELLERNQDMAPHARTRIRIAFTMGVSAPGATGLAGGAPIAVARLVNWGPFRHVMTAAARAQVGVIIDNHLHEQYVRQRFRSDINPDDYIPARVSYADKGFDTQAWIKLFGYTGGQVAALFAAG